MYPVLKTNQSYITQCDASLAWQAREGEFSNQATRNLSLMQIYLIFQHEQLSMFPLGTSNSTARTCFSTELKITLKSAYHVQLVFYSQLECR